MLRAHLAWPIFLLAGLAALHQAGALTDSVLTATTATTVAVLAAAGMIHVYWATGGRWMLDRAIPTNEAVAITNGDPAGTASPPSTAGRTDGFRPGPLLTALVALLLFTFAGLIAVTAGGNGPDTLRWLVVAGAVVLVIRAVGDNQVAGFTKKVRHTTFGRTDDAVFTPLVVMLAFGTVGSLLL